MNLHSILLNLQKRRELSDEIFYVKEDPVTKTIVLHTS